MSSVSQALEVFNVTGNLNLEAVEAILAYTLVIPVFYSRVILFSCYLRKELLCFAIDF